MWTLSKGPLVLRNPPAENDSSAQSAFGQKVSLQSILSDGDTGVIFTHKNRFIHFILQIFFEENFTVGQVLLYILKTHRD